MLPGDTDCPLCGDPLERVKCYAINCPSSASTPSSEDPEGYVRRYQHSRECEDESFIYHAATGGDAPCICGAEDNE